MPPLDELVRPRGHPVRRRVRADEMRAAEADLLAARDAAHLDLELRARELFLNAQQLAHIVRDFRRHVHRAAVELLQTPLSRVERNARRVIEMRVRDEHVRHRNDHVGAASDVERDAEVADAEDGLMPCARASFEQEVVGLQGEEVFVDHEICSITFTSSRRSLTVASGTISSPCSTGGATAVPRFGGAKWMPRMPVRCAPCTSA